MDVLRRQLECFVIFGTGRCGFDLVVLMYIEGCEQAVEVLHVGDVATEAEDAAAVEGTKATDVGESGEGAVRCCSRRHG